MSNSTYLTDVQDRRAHVQLLLVDERIRIRTNKLQIRMRIQEAQKLTDPTDLDPHADPEQSLKIVQSNFYVFDRCSRWASPRTAAGTAGWTPPVSSVSTASRFRTNLCFNIMICSHSVLGKSGLRIYGNNFKDKIIEERGFF